MTRSSDPKYVLISPCRNEARFMRETFDSVLKQSVRPSKWIVVDDGSSDDSASIAEDYAKRNAWIEVVSLPDRGHRMVGPGVIDAFYIGYNSIDPDDFDYLCKLDLDLRLPGRYFEILIDRMERDRSIATCSGKAYIRRKGKLVPEGHGDDTSLGMTKLYRVSQFKAIGGFVREVMWDGIDCHSCRMRGWKACSWDELELRFEHLRPMGSSQNGILTGRMRHGYGQYFMGTGFIYMAASAAGRILQPPVLLGSLAILWGWMWSFLCRKPRYEHAEFREFLSSYQLRVLLFGKRKALEGVAHRSPVEADAG